MTFAMGDLLQRAMGFWRSRRQPRHALALAGGGVIGGMYEVGAVAALEERLSGSSYFQVYVGCSAGAVVGSLLANGVPASEIFRIVDQDLDAPLNFRRSAVYAADSFRHAAGRFGRLLWAVGKNAVKGWRGSVPDMLAQAERDLPSGFFLLAALERFMRDALEKRGLRNAFGELEPTLLIPAIELERAQRVVFGKDALRDVPISQAVAASSAIPGFFEPYEINGRDYVDGGVGFSGHADLAAEEGASVVVVINPPVAQPDPRQRRPPASFADSGSARNRPMAATPSAGPTARTAKAQDQPAARTRGGTSQIEAIVSANPAHVWVVSAVPT